MSNAAHERISTAEALEVIVESIVTRLATNLDDRVLDRDRPPEWKLLSLDEAASRLGRSPRWLRERVKRRELAVVRLDGGSLRFTLDALVEFASVRTIPPSSALATRLRAAQNPHALNAQQTTSGP